MPLAYNPFTDRLQRIFSGASTSVDPVPEVAEEAGTSRTIAVGDYGKLLKFTNAGDVTVTLPALASRIWFYWLYTGAGTLTFAESGTTIISNLDYKASSGANASGTALYLSLNEISVAGDLAP